MNHWTSRILDDHSIVQSLKQCDLLIKSPICLQSSRSWIDTRYSFISSLLYFSNTLSICLDSAVNPSFDSSPSIRWRLLSGWIRVGWTMEEDFSCIRRFWTSRGNWRRFESHHVWEGCCETDVLKKEKIPRIIGLVLWIRRYPGPYWEDTARRRPIRISSITLIPWSDFRLVV